jgi:competence protein ComEA
MRHLIRSVVAIVGRSVWMPVLAKILLWTGAFAALAHVGTSAAGRVVEAAEGPSADAAIGAVPTAAVPQATGSSSTRAPCPEPGGATAPDGRIILNQATAADLQKLPGIGQKRAEAIIDVRERLGGRFRSVRDLLRVRGIGPRSLKRLEPLVVLDPPPPPAASSAPNG